MTPEAITVFWLLDGLRSHKGVSLDSRVASMSPKGLPLTAEYLESNQRGSPDSWVASEAAIGVPQVCLLRQDVAGARGDRDGQVPNLGACGGGVRGNPLAVLIHHELLRAASHADLMLSKLLCFQRLGRSRPCYADDFARRSFPLSGRLGYQMCYTTR